MAGRDTLIRRAILSLALWAGFWVLGVLVVAALAGIPIAQARFAQGPSFGGLAAGAAAVLVAWNLRPRWKLRWKRAAAPPPLGPDEAPALRALVAQVAAGVGVPPPDELRLGSSANASIGEERWRFGLARARVLELGLPLFALLDRAELASVIAHELGHARGGDVLLGAWVHRTRGAIAGAVDGLEGSAFFLDVPFRAYGELFLRASGAVSRAQELAADACAARTFGAAAACGALRKIELLGPAWDAYFHLDAVPAIERGAQVPLLDGFRRFLAAERRRPEVEQFALRQAQGERAAPDPGDTHPPHAERLLAMDPHRRIDDASAVRLRAGGAALRSGRSESAAPSGCLELLGGEPAAEEAWYRRALRQPLPASSWDDVGDAAILPALAKELADSPLDPARADLAGLPSLAADPAATWTSVARGVNLLSPEARRRRGLAFLGAWLAVALHRRGFHARVRPAAELLLVRGAVEVEPWSLVRALADGSVDAAGYEAMRMTWE